MTEDTIKVVLVVIGVLILFAFFLQIVKSIGGSLF